MSLVHDRVRAERLVEKLTAKGVPGTLLIVIQSWLEDRTATDCVEGARSQERVLRNQVFQGTVLGPPLWNVFYEDAQSAVRMVSSP